MIVLRSILLLVFSLFRCFLPAKRSPAAFDEAHQFHLSRGVRFAKDLTQMAFDRGHGNPRMRGCLGNPVAFRNGSQRACFGFAQPISLAERLYGVVVGWAGLGNEKRERRRLSICDGQGAKASKRGRFCFRGSSQAQMVLPVLRARAESEWRLRASTRRWPRDPWLAAVRPRRGLASPSRSSPSPYRWREACRRLSIE
jgi:hypothetical protein